jgi:hypothetical protein
VRWFDDLRLLTDTQLTVTRLHGIEARVPHLGELRLDHQISDHLYSESMALVARLRQTRCARFQDFFRAWPRHVVNFPRGRAFHRQWNVGFTAGDTCAEDHVRIGVGFRWNVQDPVSAPAAHEYLDYRARVQRRPQAFDQMCTALGNYCEVYDAGLGEVDGQAPGPLSAVVLADQPSGDGWRFFGTRLWFANSHDAAIISDHDALCRRILAVFDAMMRAGFGA